MNSYAEQFFKQQQEQQQEKTRKEVTEHLKAIADLQPIEQKPIETDDLIERMHKALQSE